MKLITFIAILLFMVTGPVHSQWKKIYLRSAMGLHSVSSELDEVNPFEEYAQLYSVRYLTRIDEQILKTIYGMYGFTEKDGKTYLDTADGLVDLEEILIKFMELQKK